MPVKRDDVFVEKTEEKLIQKGYSPKTINLYMGHIRRYHKYCNYSLGHIPKEHENDYLLYMTEQKNLSNSYINQAAAAIKFLYEEVLYKPYNVNKPIKYENRKNTPEVLTKPEMISVFNNIEDFKHKVLILILYSTNISVDQAAKLVMPDIDRRRKLIRVNQSTGKKHGYTLLSNFALEILKIYLQEYKPENWLFPGAYSDCPIN